MTGQVDVGFGAMPFGLDMVEDGRARIVATGNDVAALRTRTGRVNITNLATLTNRKDALVALQPGLQGNRRLDVFRSGRAQDLRRLLRHARERWCGGCAS